MTQIIHDIDLLQWFIGDPVEVSANGIAFVLADAIEVEDRATALITEYPKHSGAVNDLWAIPGAEGAATVFSGGVTVDVPSPESRARFLCFAPAPC